MIREIVLTQDQVALVDEEDFERLNCHKWYAQWNRCTKSFYAYRSGTKQADGKRPAIGMHREVLGLIHLDCAVADHIDPSQTLNNTKDNLRSASHNGNAQNARKRSDNSSGYKGVSWNCHDKKWAVRLYVEGKRKFFGNFDTAEEAKATYDEIAQQLYGRIARSL